MTFLVVLLLLIPSLATAAPAGEPVSNDDIYLLIVAGLCVFAFFKGFHTGQQR